MPYCFNEKSGLVSIPIKHSQVLEFEKDWAIFDRVVVDETLAFLDRKKATAGEARNLLIQSFDSAVKHEEDIVEKYSNAFEPKQDYQELQYAIPRELFPPCVQLGLQGLEDGRKRFMFTLMNFLRSVGWSYESIKELFV